MRVYLLACLTMITACKKKSVEEANDQAIVQMTEFKDAMCACKDKACADSVMEKMTRWSKKMAATKGKQSRPSKADLKKSSEIGEAFGECMTRAQSASPTAPLPDGFVPATADAPATPTSRNVDALVRQAREWATANKPEHKLARIRAAFVDREGVLDATHGSLDLSYGRVPAASDPGRRIGTPAKAALQDCFLVGTTTGAWHTVQGACSDTTDYTPLCTVAAIWQRAIERKAPADAVAVIELDIPTKTWTFAIDDEPTKLRVREQFPDDCALNVER